MQKVLIICGPTATGKTKFALELARKFNGELISADSRQVYVGKNIITGKDLPPSAFCHPSFVIWKNRPLNYYQVSGIKIWLYDVVKPRENFNVSFWHECAELVITDMAHRSILPIIVGGTGLFIMSLTQDLNQISIPPNQNLRKQLADKSIKYLFNYLNKIDSFRAVSLNISDRQNPRRLIRAIEVSLSSPSPIIESGRAEAEVLQVGLTAPNSELYKRIDQRVLDRIAAGASFEDPVLAADPTSWQNHEHLLARRQLTWFKKQPNITWFDVTSPRWHQRGVSLISNWYNK